MPTLAPAYLNNFRATAAKLQTIRGKSIGEAIH